MLDKAIDWVPAVTYDVTLFNGVTKYANLLPHCLQGMIYIILGVPGPGPRPAGTNITLALTCNTLPR